jgi:hypothetical protein
MTVTYFNTLFQHMYEGTEGKHQSVGWPPDQ